MFQFCRKCAPGGKVFGLAVQGQLTTAPAFNRMLLYGSLEAMCMERARQSPGEAGACRAMPATLDTKGMNCPLPVLKLRRAIKAVAPGDTLTVLATDPGAERDFQTFCRSQGHELLDRREQAGVFTFLIRRSESPA